MIVLDIPALCGADIISRDSGRMVREWILQHWHEPEIQICLSGRRVASLSFFDEAFGLLIRREGKSLGDLKARLRFPDLDPEDRKLLNYVLLTPPRS